MKTSPPPKLFFQRASVYAKHYNLCPRSGRLFILPHDKSKTIWYTRDKSIGVITGYSTILNSKYRRSNVKVTWVEHFSLLSPDVSSGAAAITPRPCSGRTLGSKIWPMRINFSIYHMYTVWHRGTKFGTAIEKFLVSTMHTPHKRRIARGQNFLLCPFTLFDAEPAYLARNLTHMERDGQWRRSVVKYGGQGHSGQAIKTVSDYTIRQWFSNTRQSPFLTA